MGWRVSLTLMVCFVAVAIGPGQPIIINGIGAKLGPPQDPQPPVVLEFDPPQKVVVLEFEPRDPVPEFGNDLPPIVEVPPRDLIVPDLVDEPPLRTAQPREAVNSEPPIAPTVRAPEPRQVVIPELVIMPAVRAMPQRPLQAPAGAERPRFMGPVGVDTPELPNNPVNFLTPTRSTARPAAAQFARPLPPAP